MGKDVGLIFPEGTKMNNLINRRQCKRFALMRGREMRKGGMPERVSKQFLESLYNGVFEEK